MIVDNYRGNHMYGEKEKRIVMNTPRKREISTYHLMVHDPDMVAFCILMDDTMLQIHCE